MLSSSINIKSIIHTLCPFFLRDYLKQIESSPIAYRLAKGAFWSLMGAMISRGLALLSSIIVARILGREGFGELGIIQSTVGMFGVFAGFGMGMTATKHVAEFRNKDPDKAGRIMMLAELISILSGAVMGVILILLAPWLAANTLAAPQLGNLLKISSLLLFLNAINGAQTGALAGFEAFKTIAIVNLLSGIASFPLTVIGAYFGGLKGALLGLIGAMTISWVLNHIAIRYEANKASVPYTFRDCTRECRVIWDFSVPAVLSGALVGPVNWICNAMLVNQPNGYAEMGIFNAANQWFTAFLFLPGIISQTVLPILSERFGIQDNLSSSKLLLVSIKINGLITMSLFILCSLLSPYIMGSYGAGFRHSWLTLIVVLATATLLSIQVPVGNVITAAGRMWLGFLMNCAWAIIFIFFTLGLIKFGAIGLAFSRGIAYVFHATWTFGFAYYVIKKKSANERNIIYR